MTFFSKTLIAVLATSSLSLATAATAQNAADDGWAGEASLTGSRTTGNTETTDVGLGLNLQKTTDVWRHTFKASADFGRVSGTTSRERFVLGYQIDRDLSERLYVYGNGDYFSDKFGSYEEGYFLGAGLGYKAVLPGPLGWDLEAGLGYRSQTSQSPFSVTDEELALRGASKLKYALNDNVSAYNNSEVIYGDSNTYLWNETGLTANLMGNLAARASFRIDHNTDVATGLEKTDTISRFGVVYTMK